MIKQDLHVHLHGCLSAEDLWNIGKDSYKNQSFMLDWYASEYEKAWGRKPDYRKYWESENGFDTLKSDYIFSEANHFDRFQANFNLIVALCPITSERFDIQEKIIRNVASQGLEYFEARTLIPFRLNDSEVSSYLHGLCTKVGDLNKELETETKLVFSLFRDNGLATKHYGQIRAFIEAQPVLSQVISGIDFAFAEEGSPPKSKHDFFKKFHTDNKTQKPLDLLYHVGESFGDKGMASAVRWIWEAHEMGATRLGHAIALGADPENYKGRLITEPADERLDTIRWLINQRTSLEANGFKIDLAALKKEDQEIRENNSEYIRISYDQAYIDKMRSLQIAVAALLKEKGAVIESCPTSNFRIGQVLRPRYHPLKFFHENNLNYKVCTDDPGIFDIDWVSESQLADEIISS